MLNPDNKGLYIGFTTNIKQRYQDHISGKGGFTQRYKNWKLIYFEGYKDKKDALNREKFLKGGSGRKYINKQLKNFLGEGAL